MVKNYFLNWFKQNSNFLNEPFASTELDECLADPRVQKAIAHNNTAQLCYSFFEAKIAWNYTRLIDYKLREAFDKLNRDDFSDPSGFAEKRKASLAVQNYFEIRNTLEYLVKNDVSQHSCRDSILNAFRRWITIAELLLKRHCYEGYFLVTTVLLQLDNSCKLKNELPKLYQDKFDTLCKLALPENNFKALRQLVNNNKRNDDFVPVFLRSKDLTSINQVLGDSQKINLKDIAQTHPCYGSLVFKKNLLEEIMASKKTERRKLSDSLESMFERAHKKYLASAIIHNFTEQPTPALRGANSKIYTDGLLPSFWSRKCKTSTHWSKVYDINPPSKRASL